MARLAVNISELKSGTERTKKRKKAGVSNFSNRQVAIFCLAVIFRLFTDLITNSTHLQTQVVTPGYLYQAKHIK